MNGRLGLTLDGWLWMAVPDGPFSTGPFLDTRRIPSLARTSSARRAHPSTKSAD